MCHCFSELTEMSDEQRAEVLEDHSMEELRTEYSTEELETLGVIA
jgi:chromosome segregation and condensation protein ScpB